MKPKFITVIIFVCVIVPVFADSILDAYVREGLSKNLSLLSADYGYRESIARVNEARGKFYPQVSVEARTTWNSGGRTMSFPVREIFQNPLLPEFYEMPTLPADDQEIKIRIMQPVFVSSLFYNAAIQEKLKESAELQKVMTARFIAAEIKKAYFTCMKAAEIMEVLNNTKKVLEENLRVSQKLFANGMVTEDAVFRAKAEVTSIEQKSLEAEQGYMLAAAYFNFLLQRPHDSPVTPDSAGAYIHPVDFTYEEAVGTALSFREELMVLQRNQGIQENLVGMHMGTYLPSVFVAIDCGLFANGFAFSFEDYFVTVSIVARWEAFDGFQASSKAEQAGMAAKKNRVSIEETKEKIRLEVREAYSGCLVAEKAIASAQQELEAIEKYYNLIVKKYSEGLVPQIEYYEAESRLVRAKINKTSAEYDYCIKYSQLESAAIISNREKLKINSSVEKDE